MATPPTTAAPAEAPTFDNAVDAVQPAADPTYQKDTAVTQPSMFNGKEAYAAPAKEQHVDLQKKLTDFEVELLKPASYIPGFSTLSGAVQVLYGIFEIIGAFYASLRQIRSGVCTSNQAKKAEHYVQARHNFQFAMHGFTNMVRGLIAMVPFLGNIVLGANDYFGVVKRHAYPHYAPPAAASAAAEITTPETNRQPIHEADLL